MKKIIKLLTLFVVLICIMFLTGCQSTDKTKAYMGIGDSLSYTCSYDSIENKTIINNDVDGYFLRVQKDSWGTSGKNGGDVTLTLKKQEVKGNTYIDNILTLNMMMTSNSYFEGSINSENIAKSIILKLNKSSKIKLTKDTYVTSLVDEDRTYSNIDLNSYKLYVNNVELTK